MGVIACVSSPDSEGGRTLRREADETLHRRTPRGALPRARVSRRGPGRGRSWQNQPRFRRCLIETALAGGTVARANLIRAGGLSSTARRVGYSARFTKGCVRVQPGPRSPCRVAGLAFPAERTAASRTRKQLDRDSNRRCQPSRHKDERTNDRHHRPSGGKVVARPPDPRDFIAVDAIPERTNTE